MKVRNTLSEASGEPCAITVGTFDGLHLGHRKIIEQLITVARKNQLTATILTFFPHPRMVLQQDVDLKLLHTIDEKIALMEKTGVEELIIHPFTKEFSRLSAAEFVGDILIGGLGAQKIITGYDHRFGRNRMASLDDLRELVMPFQVEIIEIPPEEVNEVSVSSTKIRHALLQGDIKTATNYLGYPFMLTGKVVRGKGLGRQLAFPTANLHIAEAYKLIPKNGVYVVKSRLHRKVVYGMMNIGYNPTVDGTEQSVEVYFFDFEGDLYGKIIQVDLLARLRDEQRFASVEALTNQLHKDREMAFSFIDTIG